MTIIGVLAIEFTGGLLDLDRIQRIQQLPTFFLPLLFLVSRRVPQRMIQPLQHEIFKCDFPLRRDNFRLMKHCFREINGRFHWGQHYSDIAILSSCRSSVGISQPKIDIHSHPSHISLGNSTSVRRTFHVWTSRLRNLIEWTAPAGG